MSAGEPVLLRVHVQNTTSEPLDLDLGDDSKGNILIAVIDPAGKRNEKSTPDPSTQSGMTFFGGRRLEPREKESETLVLNEWFEFKEIGRYQITIQLKEPPKIGGRSISIPTISLNLEVTPYDPKQLESACRVIAAEVVRPLAGQDSFGAVQALKLLQDPNLFPFWSELLRNASNQDLQEIAVAKLVFPGTQQSVEGLAQALHSRNHKARSMARSALELLAAQASDSSVKSSARNALDQR